MVLSVSRRTDIPAFFPDWLVGRLRAGCVAAPDPYRSDRLFRIRFSPETIDCIVFWTKNPAPLSEKLDAIERLGYKNYYFEFTLTPYSSGVEKQVPPKERLIGAFQRLSNRLGPERVDWRFDPVLLNEIITESFLFDRFEQYCRQLAAYTTRCIISWIDIYRHLRPAFRSIDAETADSLARRLAEIASAYRLQLAICSEAGDYSRYGIIRSACIDQEKIERLTGYRLRTRKDNGQRSRCGCMESIDIGVYNTCRHGCAYCYATAACGATPIRNLPDDPSAPMLTGYPTGREIIIEKQAVSLRETQLLLNWDN